MSIKHTIKRRFTMVEILLAAAVMGAGLTLILILFPVALRNAQATVINSYVPMTANHFINLTKARIAADVKPGSSPTAYYYFNENGSFVKNLRELSSVKNDLNDPGKSLGASVAAPNYNKLVDKVKDSIPTEYGDGQNGAFVWQKQTKQDNNGLAVTKPEMEAVSFFTHDKQTGRYLVMYKSQKEEEGSADNKTLQYSVVDFAAEINILKDKIGDIYPYSGLSSSLEPYAAKLYIHVSWPIEIPLANRQSRLYVLDVFNSNFGSR